MAFAVGQKVTADELNLSGVVRRGRRTTASSVSTGADVGVLRVSDVPCKAGRLYLVTCVVPLDSTVINDEIRARIRYTTDGTNATSSSAILPGSLAQTRQTDQNVPEHKTIMAWYPSTTDHTASFLLCVGRLAGTGNCIINVDGAGGDSLDLVILDCEDDPGDTGVDI